MPVNPNLFQSAADDAEMIRRPVNEACLSGEETPD